MSSGDGACSREDPVHDGLLERAIETGRSQGIFWEPAEPTVVLGRADRVERACREDVCRALGIPVVKRRGGGGTVLLAGGMLVLTMSGEAGLVARPRGSFERVNGWIADGLVAAGGPRLVMRGISDLCLGERKLLGSSLAFARGHVLYQGVLLVDSDLELVSRTLRHPEREPDYRRGRSHADFLTTLAREGFAASAAALARHFQARFGAEPPLPVDSSRDGASEAQSA